MTGLHNQRQAVVTFSILATQFIALNAITDAIDTHKQ